MKSGLCFIYTSLLTISVISSCALFILVVSEGLHDEGDVQAKVDLSGLHNISQNVNNHDDPKYRRKTEITKDEPKDYENVKETKKTIEKEHEMTFGDTLSLNSVTTDGLPDTGQPPILISLGENAKLDLRNPEELLFVNESEQHNDTKSFVIVDRKEAIDENVKTNAETTESHLVVKAVPMHETRLTEETYQLTTPAPEVDTTESQIDIQTSQEPEDIPVKPQTPQEDIPSFSEWAQKQLAEAEKDTVLNHSTQPSHSNSNFSSKNTKIRSKNYASPACGAKIVAANPEAGSASSILSPNRDEYMLNTCNSRIWFVVELCEAVQAQKIELANFELFSSTPKDFVVYFSDRFPTREWASVGQFTAEDIRDVQSFDLYPHLFGKFIKVELLSHHGSEHYCPISLFKVYGTSEFEVLEKESSNHAAHIDDEDDEIIDVPDLPAVEKEPSKNLFGSARDAVMSIVKKAAQALVKTEVPKNISSERNDTSVDMTYRHCCSPSHIIVCDNCSEALYNEVFELISCSSDKLTNLLRQVFLRDTLKCTGVCRPFGLDFKSTKTIEFSDERAAYLNAFFTPKYLAALCNILAINEKKVVLNTSFESEENVTTNVTIENTTQNVNGETNAEQDVKLVPPNISISDNEVDKVTQEKTIVPNDPKDIFVTEEKMEEKDKTDDKKECPAVVKTDREQEEISSQEPVKLVEVNSDKENKDIPKDKTGKAEVATEKIKETSGMEESEQIMIDGDSFLTDLDQMAVDPTPQGTVPMSNQNQAQQSLQKESVFLRLSNRVKTLERNMSLSGQYLEELSRRYKKQVEEMQKTFEKTVLQMTEERRRSNEREQKYIEQMSSMQEQLTQITIALALLMEERDSWFGNITFFKFIVLQSIIVGCVWYYFTKRRRKVEPVPVISKRARKKQEKFRRKSVEGVSGHETPSAKKRRPSEEALLVARKSAEDIYKEDDEGEWQVARKNRRRKTSVLHRNIETETKLLWGRQDSIGKLQENPIPLDDEEFIAPVTEPKEFNDKLSPIPPKREFPKTNGSIFTNLKAKTMKTRRLSSPAFLRTFSRQSSRSQPSPAVKNLEPIFNGKVKSKAGSESPTASICSQSTDMSNGTFDPTKKKRGLKSIFRKVF